jgi:hypothetical protein
VGGGDGLDYGQAEAAAAARGVIGPGRVLRSRFRSAISVLRGTMKAVKRPRRVLRCHPGACVRDLDQDAALDLPEPHGDLG